MNDSNIALLIDYENVGIESMQDLVEEIAGIGRIIVKRAYADWSSQRKGQERLIELGIEAIHNYRSPKSGKNSCDIKLTIDAVELLHSAKVDTFVIVSSDSDFVPLVNHLRGAGKNVLGAGRKDVTSTTMVKSCDRYIFLSPKTAPVKPSNDIKKPIKSKGTLSQNTTTIANSTNSLEYLLIKAVEATLDEQGTALGTKLAQTITRLDPSFNYKQLGYRSFREFLQSQKEIEVTVREGTDFTVSIVNDENILPKKNSDLQDLISKPTQNVNSEHLPDNWESMIVSSWQKNQKDTISGRSAAAQAAEILGFRRLRDSLFPTLDKLLQSSDKLSSIWTRNKNYIVKK
jgi:uncharacterized protein (TIGR00288 family)